MFSVVKCGAFLLLVLQLSYSVPLDNKKPLLNFDSYSPAQKQTKTETHHEEPLLPAESQQSIQKVLMGLQQQVSKVQERFPTAPVTPLNTLTQGAAPVDDDITASIKKLKEQAELYQMINDMLKAEMAVQAQPYAVEAGDPEPKHDQNQQQHAQQGHVESHHTDDHLEEHPEEQHDHLEHQQNDHQQYHHDQQNHYQIQNQQQKPKPASKSRSRSGQRVNMNHDQHHY